MYVTQEVTRAKIIELLKGINPQRVDESIAFDENGFDSLDVIELVMEIEEHFDVEVNDHVFETEINPFQIATAGEFFDRLAAYVHNAA